MFWWRFLLGAGLIWLVVVLGWADHRSALPGAMLLPLAVGISLLSTGEFLALAKASGISPFSTWPVYVGNIAMLLAAWLPVLAGSENSGVGSGQSVGPERLWAAPGWVLLALAGALLVAMLEEIRRFAGPGGITSRLGVASLGLLYGGLLLSFLVLLRMGYGIGALASLIIVVKMADTGAYFVGHLIGRHKLAPRLSPGKTIEGTLGGLVWAWAAAWVVFTWLTPALTPYAEAPSPNSGFPSSGLLEGRSTSAPPVQPARADPCPWWGWTSYGLVLGLVGLGGDLAESLLKRDAGRKDSSQWMPGFGGVLDLMDSLLWAAPVAYLWWHLGWVW